MVRTWLASPLIVGHNVNYLMYLAVNDRIRSKGYGTQILTHLKATYPAQTLVLEIEHPDPKATNTKQRFARLQFYLKITFTKRHTWPLTGR